ncbi:MAG: hypothetical protein Q4D26_09610 [Clostridia bacterium]|nr:hypothetical protein [Clostridia bacterium]
MYDIIVWVDHAVVPGNTYTITKNDDNTYKLIPAGEIIQNGTPLSAKNFNNMEEGILAANITSAEALNQLRFTNDRVNDCVSDIYDVTLTNTQEYPFNDSSYTVAFPAGKARNNKNYHVHTEAVSCSRRGIINGGGIGDIVISDKMLNGFKIRFTGAADTVTLKIFVQGGL